MQRFQSQIHFASCIWLMEDHAQLNTFVTVKNCRSGFPAHIAIDALIVDVEGAGNIFREPLT